MKKNIFKKIVASLATVAMAAGLFTAMPAEEAMAAKVINVTVKGEGAEAMATGGTLNLHMWGGAETSWPGEALTDNANNTWSKKDIVATSEMNFIVNNGTDKTGNIEGVKIDKKDIILTVAADKTVAVTYGDTASEDFDPDAGKTKKDIEVNVKLEEGLSLDEVRLHTFDTGLAGGAGWPGIELTLKDGVYTGKVQIENSVTAFKGLVNNGGDEFKTEDLVFSDVSTGKIYITVKSDKTAEVATSKPASWTTGSGSTTPPTTTGNKTPEVKNEVKVEVTLDPSLKWDEVYVHAWGDNFSTKWPGVKMTAKDGKYYATIDTKLTKLSYVISAGDKKDQTIDIKDVNGQDVKITVTAKKDADGKKFVATAKTAGTTGTAKPGDVAPVVVMLVVAMAAASVVVASKKKTICE